MKVKDHDYSLKGTIIRINVLEDGSLIQITELDRQDGGLQNKAEQLCEFLQEKFGKDGELSYYGLENLTFSETSPTKLKIIQSQNEATPSVNYIYFDRDGKIMFKDASR